MRLCLWMFSKWCRYVQTGYRCYNQTRFTTCPGSMRSHNVSYPQQFYMLLDVGGFVGAYFDYKLLVTHLGHIYGFLYYVWTWICFLAIVCMVVKIESPNNHWNTCTKKSPRPTRVTLGTHVHSSILRWYLNSCKCICACWQVYST